jgi:hypothetical protein
MTSRTASTPIRRTVEDNGNLRRVVDPPRFLRRTGREHRVRHRGATVMTMLAVGILPVDVVEGRSRP